MYVVILGNAHCISHTQELILVWFLFSQEYFSLSMEDAVHQPMTAHLEASAVAGISSSGPEREPLQPTILTLPYGTMGKLYFN